MASSQTENSYHVRLRSATHCLDRASGIDISALDAEFFGNRFFGRPAEAVEIVCDASILESHHLEDFQQLCFQQSSGNSTGPKVYVPSRRFR